MWLEMLKSTSEPLVRDDDDGGSDSSRNPEIQKLNHLRHQVSYKQLFLLSTLSTD